MHLEDPLVRTSEVAARSDVDPTLQTDRPPEADGPTPGVPRVPGAPADSSAPGRFRWDLVAKVAVVGSLVLAVWLRFWTPSALWLDEALTVDIARAPLHQIPQLLRHDGAPPLYYYLLHFWM
jgi:hypothetical protein